MHIKKPLNTSFARMTNNVLWFKFCLLDFADWIWQFQSEFRKRKEQDSNVQ